jgi:hypothetical protein
VISAQKDLKMHSYERKALHDTKVSILCQSKITYFDQQNSESMTEALAEEKKHRQNIVRSTKRCRRCILGLPYPANMRLETRRIWHEIPTPGGCTSVHCVNSGTLASNWQITSKYKDDISLLI